jgi:mRNA interferase HigB
MHVIAKPILVDFWTQHPAAKSPLTSWYRIMQKAVFTDFNDLRAMFPSADYVGGLTVFNIGGNKYRLIASIHYNRHKIYIRAVLTHEEYDQGGWKQKRSN